MHVEREVPEMSPLRNLAQIAQRYSANAVRCDAEANLGPVGRVSVHERAHVLDKGGTRFVEPNLSWIRRQFKTRAQVGGPQQNDAYAYRLGSCDHLPGKEVRVIVGVAVES